MKRYILSHCESINHTPEYPERTARRAFGGMNFDFEFQVWPNRPAMLKTLEMQDRRAPTYRDWKPCRKEGV